MAANSTTLRHRAATALTLALTVSGGAMVAATDLPDAPSAPPMPELPMEELRGNTAVAFVEAYDIELAPSQPNAKILERLADDPLMFVSTDGMVGYTEPVATDPAPGGGVAEAAMPVGTDVFALHSRPASTRVVYLDFDGHTTTGQYWNSTYEVEPIVSGAYNIDSNAGAFSATEQQRIYDIWSMVADDFAPFDVDVTTEDPGVEALRKTSGGDTAYGQRVVITSTDWYYASQGGTIGGIALIDVFSASVDYSAFVFAGNLGGGHAKYVAEAASHEAGHTFGMFHDGASGTSYYAGHGDWAPIMGVGYARSITQWSRGEYTGANNTEDDLAMIREHVAEVADDHGDTPAGATPVGTTSSTAGVLAIDDVDVFTVDAGSGPMQVTVTPTGGNLHARVTLATDAGTTLDTAAPATATGFTVTADATVTAGTYRVTVEAIGWLAPSTGFSDYASTGAYTLTVTATAPAAVTTTTSTTSTTAPATTAPTTTAPTTAPTTTTTTTTTTAPRPPAADTRAGFTAMTSRRIVDTRSGLGGKRRLAAGRMVAVQVAGAHGIPNTANAAVVNVTAVAPSGSGRLSVLPCTGGTTETSAVHYAAGQVVANTTIATLDARGRFCVWTSTEADLLVDVTGWLAPATGARLTPVGPTRVADTRSGLGGYRRLAAGRTMALDLSASAPGASAVALNVTVVGADAPGYVTVFPCGTTRPSTSTINHTAGEVRPNNTIVGVRGGKVCVYTLAAADVLVDLVGTFRATGLGYVPTVPERLVDTRDLGKRLSAGTELEYGVGTSPLGRPAAASITVTALDHLRDGYTSTYPCGKLPATSTVNQITGQTASNGAIARATASATSCAYTLNGGHLLIDLTGWWL